MVASALCTFIIWGVPHQESLSVCMLVLSAAGRDGEVRDCMVSDTGTALSVGMQEPITERSIELQYSGLHAFHLEHHRVSFHEHTYYGSRNGTRWCSKSSAIRCSPNRTSVLDKLLESSNFSFFGKC